MSDGLIELTFEGDITKTGFTGDLNNQLYDMTVDIPEGKTMILKQARFEIGHSSLTDYPKSVNIGIGSVMSTNFVIDNDAGYNYVKVGLDYNIVTTSGVPFATISITYPDSGFKISGRLSKNCRVVLLDKNHVVLTNVTYYFLQFVVI